jgi:hypothetical protein
LKATNFSQKLTKSTSLIISICMDLGKKFSTSRRLCKWSCDATVQILKISTTLTFLRYTSQRWTFTVLSMLALSYHHTV